MVRSQWSIIRAMAQPYICDKCELYAFVVTINVSVLSLNFKISIGRFCITVFHPSLTGVKSLELNFNTGISVTFKTSDVVPSSALLNLSCHEYVMQGILCFIKMCNRVQIAQRSRISTHRWVIIIFNTSVHNKSNTWLCVCDSCIVFQHNFMLCIKLVNVPWIGYCKIHDGNKYTCLIWKEQVENWTEVTTNKSNNLANTDTYEYLQLKLASLLCMLVSSYEYEQKM